MSSYVWFLNVLLKKLVMIYLIFKFIVELPIKKVPIHPVTTQAKQVYNYEVDKLIPGADYNVKLLVKYKRGTNFTWPNNYNQNYKCHGS